MNNVCEKLHVLSTVSIANADIKDMVMVYICIALNRKPLKATRWPLHDLYLWYGLVQMKYLSFYRVLYLRLGHSCHKS